MECIWNKVAIEDSHIQVNCNDLYHLYESTETSFDAPKKSIKLGAFNVYKLGTGESRFKNLSLVASLVDSFDLMGASELHHNTAEELWSNRNLADNPQLNFADLYHKPGYLKLLIELQKLDPSWSLILSPSGQSGNDELLGIYFRKSQVKLQNSQYCLSYRREFFSSDFTKFNDSLQKEPVRRKSVLPDLSKSYGCFIKTKRESDDISRLPFLGRFKTTGGFDFHYLSYHARFRPPRTLRGSCKIDCLDKVTELISEAFHPEGSFLPTLDFESLRLLSKHLEYLSLEGRQSDQIQLGSKRLLRLKAKSPEIFKNLEMTMEFLNSNFSEALFEYWKTQMNPQITRDQLEGLVADLDSLLFKPALFDEIKRKNRNNVSTKRFLDSAFKKYFLFSEITQRRKIWTSPENMSRFFELSLLTEEMEHIADLSGDSDVVLGGDLNLNQAKNSFFWNQLRKLSNFSHVSVGRPTSISKKSGLNSSYDHFIYSKHESMEECRPEEAFVLDFVSDRRLWGAYVDYFVESPQDIEHVVKKYHRANFETDYVYRNGQLRSPHEINRSVVKFDCLNKNQITLNSLGEVWENDLKCRTLNHVLEGPEPYRVHTDFISDHLPIGFTCESNQDLDS